jgi:hypothetical protein
MGDDRILEALQKEIKRRIEVVREEGRFLEQLYEDIQCIKGNTSLSRGTIELIRKCILRCGEV